MRNRLLWIALAVSVAGNAVFIRAYVGAENASVRPGTEARIGPGLYDAVLDLKAYARTHNPAQINRAAMWLEWLSGILMAYSIHTNDGIANQFSLMLGNLGGDLALRQQVPAAVRVIDQIERGLPLGGPAMIQAENSQAVFDRQLWRVMQSLPPPWSTPLY